MTARDDLIAAIAVEMCPQRQADCRSCVTEPGDIRRASEAIDRLGLRVGGVAERAVLDAAAAVERTDAALNTGEMISWIAYADRETAHRDALATLVAAVRAWRGAAPITQGDTA